MARLGAGGGGNQGKVARAKMRKQKKESDALKREAEELEESKLLHVTEFITANELAQLMGVPVTRIITTCFSLGLVVSINQRLDAEVIELLSEEFGFQCRVCRCY
jgi:translation initiation factor IF-2